MTIKSDMLAEMRFPQRLRPGSEAKAVDVWLRQSLSRRFDETLAARVPEELATLVSRFEN